MALCILLLIKPGTNLRLKHGFDSQHPRSL